MIPWSIRFGDAGLRPPCMVCITLLTLLVNRPVLAAQEAPALPEAWLAGLALEPASRLVFPFEVTIMKIDVADVTALLDASTAAEVRAIVASGPDDKLHKNLVAAALTAADTLAFGFKFKRGGSFDRFMKATRKNLDKAEKAGFVSSSEADIVWVEFQGFMTPLAARGAQIGDQILYRINPGADPSGVTLWYLDPEGKTLASQQFSNPCWGPAVKGQMIAEGVKLRDHFLKAAWPH